MQKGPFTQIVYTSLVADQIDGGDLFAMIQGAPQRYASMDITGRLVLAHGVFLHALEGPPQRVESWIDLISKDPRHHSMKVLSRNKVLQRQFKGWRMQRIHIRDRADAWQALDSIVAGNRDAASILSDFEDHVDNKKLLAS